jgi:hypothetical protein
MLRPPTDRERKRQRQREQDRERKRRCREQKKAGRMCVTVVIGADEIDWLERERVVPPREMHTRKQLGAAITEVLRLSARMRRALR